MHDPNLGAPTITSAPSAVSTLPPPAKLGLIPGFPRRVHLLGAGGAGVSALARLLVDHGHSVSGHDRSESEHTSRLREMGVALEVCPQAQASLPADASLVIRSAAVSLDDPCVGAALERHVPVLKYAEALGRATPLGRTLAIAGTHGKTTTSWMVYHALCGLHDAARERGLDVERLTPGAVVGGACRSVGANAVTPGAQGWCSVEACEYDRSFLCLSPQAAVITNVEADHLDYYGTLEAIRAEFMHFVDRLPLGGALVLGRDVPRRVETTSRGPVWKLGRELKTQVVAEELGRFRFRLEGPGFVVETVELSAPGHFNVDNAACAIAIVVATAAKAYGFDAQSAAQAAARGVARFGGAERRFEPWGEVGDCAVVHDYAHHPTEVRVTLATARRAFPGRALHVLFQPHQHSRTAHFLAEFAEALRAADAVVVADVYGARVHIDGQHTAGAPELVERIASLGGRARLGGPATQAAACAAQLNEGPRVLLVLGAGDIVNVRDDLLSELAGSRARRS